MPRRSGNRSLACARAMVEKAGGAERIAGIGITNQRETIVFWSRRTGEALARAIVWQDRRTAEDCARLKEAGHEPALQAKTGLLLDPYFSASKIAWALRRTGRSSREAGDDLCDRHGRELAGLQADRRAARHRRDQRLAHRADGHPQGRLGRGAARPVRRAARRRCPRSSIAPGAIGETAPTVRRADPDLRHGRRPAGGGDRPGLLRARRHQGDLRHRRVRADPYRRRRRRCRGTGC